MEETRFCSIKENFKIDEVGTKEELALEQFSRYQGKIVTVLLQHIVTGFQS